jgi:hypothetical protein
MASKTFFQCGCMEQGDQFFHCEKHRKQIQFSREIASFPEGEAVLYWPSSISTDSVNEMEEWLAFLVAKLKRRQSDEPARPDDAVARADGITTG